MAFESSKRALVLLLIGAVIGIAAAAAGLVAAPSQGGRLPRGAVARVNGSLIRQEEYDRLIAAAAQDRRDALDAAQRRHVLDRLIEEELLVQRGLGLGLAEHDRKVRSDLSMAVIASITEEYAEQQPSDEELRRFLEQNLDFFAGPGRLRVREVFVRAASGTDPGPAQERAQKVVDRLRAGDDFATVQTELGDTPIAPVPDALLPPSKLRDYLGPTALQTALGLEPGQIGDPVRSSLGYHVIQVTERQADRAAPPLAEIRPQVLTEYRRRAGEDALRRYLAELRRRAEVVVARDLP